MRRSLSGAAGAAALLLAGCGGDAPDGPVSRSSEPAVTTPRATDSPSTSSPTTRTATASAPEATAEPPKPRRPRQRDVLAISVDGLHVEAIDDDGALRRLVDEGAATLNARTAVEMTVTLPNHTGMLTGLRIDAARGGHGVTWNDEVPGRAVPGPDGAGVASVFDVVHDAGGSTALFAGKDKFATFERSWAAAIDEFEVAADADDLVDEVRADLASERRRLTFLHLALPDVEGHASGWLSPAYLAAVEETDRLLEELLATIEATPRLSKRLVLVLTSDHGGTPGTRSHEDAGQVANYRIPFIVWGRGIPATDLYALNPDYVDPGADQPAYDGPRPVRNGDLANLVTDLLGLGPVPGSELNREQALDVR